MSLALADTERQSKLKQTVRALVSRLNDSDLMECHMRAAA
jgi:hypothetical protein